MGKTGWKVVKKRDEAFCSAVFPIGPWSCRYAVGERTKGLNNTPVLAFRTRQAARNFRHHNVLPGGGHIVFKAQLENPRPQYTIAATSRPEAFRDFWRGTLFYSPNIAPDGTLACDAITLLEPA